MFTRLVSAIVLWIILATSSSAGIRYSLSDFQTRSTNAHFGYTAIDSNTYFKASLLPRFSVYGLELELGLTGYVPLGNAPHIQSADSITLRSLAYDYNNTHGFKYGRLSNVTLGQGLLVDHFDSGAGGTSEFVQRKAAFMGYTSLYNTQLTALASGENVHAVRLARPLFSIGDIPVVMGVTYAEDTDGIDDASSGVRVTRPKQQGFAGDIALPVGGNFLTLYSEYAELTDRGKGVSLGLRGDLYSLFTYRAEYRDLSQGFAPGYFNHSYQSTSFSFQTDAIKKRMSGFLVDAGTQIMDDYIKAGLRYERYDSTDVLSLAAGFRKIGPLTGVINGIKPFNSADTTAVITADIYYETGKLYTLLFRIKRIYTTRTQYEESMSIGASIDLNALIPSLPL